MEMIYYTLVAVFLYVAADWILDRIEITVGRRLEYRSLAFFVILLALALISFALIRRLSGG
jgi:hypothetical protein